ncbi:hypothetical protein CG51_16550 [Haematobacter missouriensis]|nr:hypothetical protein CG51_16550 [Haematobacter missouriensis]
MSYLIHTTGLLAELQDAPHFPLIQSELRRKVADAGRAEAGRPRQFRQTPLQQLRIRGVKPDLMAGKPQESAVLHDTPCLRLVPQKGKERLLRQTDGQGEAQPLAPHALRLRVLGVPCVERRDQPGNKRLPPLAVHQDTRLAAADCHGLRLRRQQGAVPKERLRRDEPRLGQQHGRQWIRRFRRPDQRQPLWRAPPPLRRARVEKPAAADCPPRGHVPQDEAVAHRRRHRPVEHDLAQTGRSRQQGAIERDDTRIRLRRAGVEAGGEPCAERLRLLPQHADPGIDPLGRRVQGRGDQHVPPVDRFA